jgi:hypothetical protein
VFRGGTDLTGASAGRSRCRNAAKSVAACLAAKSIEDCPDVSARDYRERSGTMADPAITARKAVNLTDAHSKQVETSFCQTIPHSAEKRFGLIWRS